MTMSARETADFIRDLEDAGVCDDLIGFALIARAIDNVAHSVTEIARGDINGPGGIEGLTMAISGEGKPETSGCLARAVSEVADRLGDIAEKLP